MNMPPATINALVTEQAVNLGDHAQDIVRAVTVEPWETVEQLVARHLTTTSWSGEVTVNPDRYLTIRLAPVLVEPTSIDGSDQ